MSGKPAPLDELEPRQRAFLAAYTKLGNQSAAARASKLNRRSHAIWMKKEGPNGDAYRQAYQNARLEAIGEMEAEARRRAMEGARDLVTHNGQPVFVWVKNGAVVPEKTKGAKLQPLYTTKFSDTLLMFLLKGAKPEKYRDRVDNRHSGPGGGPIRIGVEALRQELVGNDEYLDFQRSRAIGEHMHAGLICTNGQQRQVANGQAPGTAGPQTNGHHKPT